MIARLCALALLMVSCGDPVRDEGIAALGPEDPEVHPGPNHRPGQPCLLCHNEAGKAAPFSLAGTVYLDAMSAKPVGNVAVSIVDSMQGAVTFVTNCAGNFFVRPAEFQPTYPFWVTMRAGSVLRDMESPVYREGSCAGCHADPRSRTSAGHVFLIDDPTVETPPPSECN